MTHGVSRLVLVAALAGLFAGCGADRVPTYPVSGRLTINGKPPGDGWVAVLHLEPAPTGEKYPHPLPRAKVEADGRFAFRTYEDGDGAPAGTFKISFINVMELESGVATPGARAKGPAPKPPQLYWPNLLEIRPEPSELPPFDLKR